MNQSGQAIRMIGTVQDITDYRCMEEQLRQAQKMEAVGLLAGGIAHDFNNLLTVINGYGNIVLDGLPASDPNRKMLEELIAAGNRATALTGQLLTFGRRQLVELKCLRINAVVTDVEKLLRRMIGEDVELHFLLAPDAGHIRADQGQMEQVILNLAINARDAMPRGGKIILETANMNVDESTAGDHAPAPPGHYVMLAVEDTGAGMDPQILSRIFEPFFTTKEVGHGTGLGLATVFAIVKHCQGYIWAYSEPGHGTRFKIYLPRVTEELEITDPVSVRSASVRGSETILLVDDDAGVRGVAQMGLEQRGYVVLAAAGAQQALEICRTHEGPLHVLLTDVVMPKMSGPELAGRISALWPDVRIVYMSGYTDNLIDRHGVLEPGIMFLRKPFTAESLAHKVRVVLEQRRETNSWSHSVRPDVGS